MIEKIEEKNRAVKLRRLGKSYSEILRNIPVAKSTLSLWLRGVGLSKRQKQNLTEKRLLAIQKAGLIKKKNRVDLTDKIKEKARAEVSRLSRRDLWLIGTALYWAEGSKQKEHNPSQGTIFSNSDPYMLCVFLKWLQEVVKIKEEDIKFELYIHETFSDYNRAISYWSKILNVPSERFRSVYLKKGRVSVKRKNIHKGYYGLIRIVVKRGTNLNRKISGWVEGIIKNCGVVQLVTRLPLEQEFQVRFLAPQQQ